MKRQTTTIIIDDPGCAGGSAHSLEDVLARLAGVTRVYVNPATETAYVEFDADRCTEMDIVHAAKSIGIHAMPSRLQ